MKIVRAENGKKTVKISKSEWAGIGKKAGWMKQAQYDDILKDYSPESRETYLRKQYQGRDGVMYSYMDLESMGDRVERQLHEVSGEGGVNPEEAEAYVILEDKLSDMWNTGKYDEYLDLIFMIRAFIDTGSWDELQNKGILPFG